MFLAMVRFLTFDGSTFEKFFTTVMMRSVTALLSKKLPAAKLRAIPQATAGATCIYPS